MASQRVYRFSFIQIEHTPLLFELQFIALVKISIDKMLFLAKKELQIFVYIIGKFAKNSNSFQFER
jgi:hypothetical protein